MPRWRRLHLVPALLPALLPSDVGAQRREASGEVAAYFRSVGEHFRVAEAELEVLSAWGLPPEHLPVALFMAHRAGVSADALISQRRAGRSWSEVAAGIGLDASSFHVLMPGRAPLGTLASAYRRFEATPRGRWTSIELTDGEVVALVNVRVLSAVLDVTPARVLEVAARTGSFVSAHARLRSGRSARPACAPAVVRRLS